MRLKPFQEDGRDFLASHRYALLADEMRLGKTAQAITAAQKVGASRILVVCPAIAITHWETDFKRWWPDYPRLVVASYDHMRRHVDAYKGPKWDVLVLDESHMLKSPDAQRTRAILGKGGIAWHTHRVWALSGTPAPNNASELWPLLRTFGATRADFDQFRRRYCNVDPLSDKIYGNKKANLPELRAILGTVMRRRLKKTVAAELPKCTLSPLFVKPDPSNVDLAYQFAVSPDDWIEKAESMEAVLKRAVDGMSPDEMIDYLDANVAELATLRRITALLKSPALVDLIDFELTTGLLDKAVVFGYHMDAMHVSRALLKEKGWRVDMIYGGTPRTKRDAVLKRFNRPTRSGGSRVLFAQIIAAGTAIDLSSAHEGFLLERDWVPGNNAQALERMGGYKQTMPVVIRDLIIPGSIDEIIAGVVNRKMADLADIYED